MSPWLPDETALAKSRATSFPLIVAVLCLLAAASRPAGAAKTIRCPDGSQRLELDVGTLSLQYSGDSLSATISSIDILRGHLTVGPTSIHQIATATQLWNEYIKGLAAGYNSCAISRAELSEGLTKVYPRITSTAAELDKFRQALSEGRQVDDQRLQQRLDSYFKDLRRFIDISRSQILLERVQAGVTRLLVDFEELLRHLRQQNVLSAPVVVGGEISALAAARAAQATVAYQRGYDLADRQQFKEAIPYFERALAMLPLHEFFVAAGTALTEAASYDRAAQVLRQGLAVAVEEQHRDHQAELSLRLGEVFLKSGDFKTAGPYAATALALHTELAPGSRLMVEDLRTLGLAEKAAGKFEQALAHLREAYEMSRRASPRDPPNTASLASDLGTALYESGDLVAAEQNARAAIDELVGEPPDHLRLASLYSNLAAILWGKGDIPGAAAAIRRAMTESETVLGANHPGVAVHLNNLGQILFSQDEHKEALAAFERALRINEQAWGTNHQDVATVKGSLAGLQQAMGNLDGALANAEDALRIYRFVYGEPHEQVALALGNVGEILRSKGDLDAALSRTDEALAMTRLVLGAEHPRVAALLGNRGLILFEKEDFTAAVATTEEALVIDEKVLPAGHPDLAIRYSNLAAMLSGSGSHDRALELANRALAIDAKAFGEDSANAATDHRVLATVLEAKGDLEGAIAHARQGLAIDEAHQAAGGHDAAVARGAYLLGKLLARRGETAAAQEMAERAALIFGQLYGEEHPRTREARELLRTLREPPPGTNG